MIRNLLRDVRLALSLLTVLPVGAKPPSIGERTRAADHFPLVGILFGGLGVLVAWLSGSMEGGPQSELLAVSLVASWALLSRGLHWDGLSDVADAWTVPPQRRLDVMKDSHTGAFGALAIVVAFGMQSMSLAVVLSESGMAPLVVCAAVPVFGRLSASFAAWFGKPVRPDGLGSSVLGAPGPGALGGVLVIVGVMILAFRGGATSLAAGVAGLVSAAVTPHVIASRFGGVNGDVMGASIVTTELLVALTAALVSSVT